MQFFHLPLLVALAIFVSQCSAGGRQMREEYEPREMDERKLKLRMREDFERKQEMEKTRRMPREEESEPRESEPKDLHEEERPDEYEQPHEEPVKERPEERSEQREEPEKPQPKPRHHGNRRSKKGEGRSDSDATGELTKKFVWGYHKYNGPRVWPYYFPTGKGMEQSPINIETQSPAVGFDRLLTPLKFDYKPLNLFTIKNNGRGFVVEFHDKSDSSVSGGPLANEYQLRRMVVHWGKKDDRGSEHMVDGQSFPAEVQFMHYNKVKYGTFDEAATHGDGLAIVSVFMKLGENKNRAVSILTKYLHKIPKAFMEIKLNHEILQTADILPKEVEQFWTYPGSLTQPPLTENVIWIILRNPVEFSAYQLEDLRRFFAENVRTVQPLNDRVIRASFHERARQQPAQ